MFLGTRRIDKTRIVRIRSEIRMLGNVNVLVIMRLLFPSYRKTYRTLQVCISLHFFSITINIYNIYYIEIILFRAKKVYICGLLFYSCGMMLMAMTRHQASVIIFSWTAGVMYSTLFTMPYLLIAHYHASDTVSL